MGLVVYALGPVFSRALSVRAAAAAATTADVFGPVVIRGDEGFSGRGGGARSGSEESHLTIK